MTLKASALAAKSQKIKDIFFQTLTSPKSPTIGITFCEPTPSGHQEYELTSYNDIHRWKGNVESIPDKTLNFAGESCQPNQDGDMKFSHSIQFNAVPDWGNHYIAYSNLKKLIYQLEKSFYKQNSDDVEYPLLISLEEPDEIFKKSLDAELEKITSFYINKELEIFQETADLLREAGTFETGPEQHDGQETNTSYFPKFYRDRPRTASLAQNYFQRSQGIIGESIDEGIEDSEDDNESTALHKSKSKPVQRRKSLPYNLSSHERIENRHRRRESLELPRFNRRLSQISDDDFESDSLFYSAGITLRKRTINLFVQLCELKSFVQLNKTGFVKVLKKYDKTMNRNLKDNYVSVYVSPAKPFLTTTAKNIESKIEMVEQLYANLVTNGDLSLAKRELRLNLREHVVWERNTIWREMIGMERKAQAVHLGIRRTILGADNRQDFARLQGDNDDVLESKKGFTTRYGRLYLPPVLLNSSFLYLIAIVAIFIILLRLPMKLRVEEQNCLAMLVFVSLLWATEAIPLFVTALIIPFLCVVLRIVRSDEAPYYRLNPSDATKYIFAAMWTPVIMLLLGGFTIAAALSKYDIARRIATFVLSRAGSNPNVVLITNMFVAAFASMWISNVAAPVLCFSIIQPLLRNLPPESEMSKALLLGIALASNIGGMLSPIASPQNIVGLQIMEPPPSWGSWFFVALPIGIISIFLIWLILLVSFRPSNGTTIVPIRSVKEKFTGIQWFISISTLLTIVLWCVSHQLQWIFGDMGVIAILPIILFFGSGILSKEDFNNFLWTIIILAAGGLSLGKAVSSSGLLHTVAGQITERVSSLSTFGIFVVFTTLTLCVATFISHTVAALIILPLVHRVGMNMTDPHPNLLVMGCALTCSAAMGLPTSGFPNMTAIMMENPQTGQRYLKVDHFLTRGIPASIVTLLIIISIGYATMFIIGL